jgi:hypothetical protein
MVTVFLQKREHIVAGIHLRRTRRLESRPVRPPDGPRFHETGFVFAANGRCPWNIRHP